MLTFPLRNAALDLKGKLPEELPHGLLPIPPEVLECVERERSRMRPELFEANRQSLLNDWTVGWYFDKLFQQVLYRRTPEGPEVLAVGTDEVLALRKSMPEEEQRQLKTFLGD
jgi:hypothetical protein